MRYAPEQEIPLPPMQDGEGARILSKTMGKIKETKRKPARPVRTVLIAAAIAALLCGSAFAAHSFGWFDQLFGEKAALVKDHVTSYDEKNVYRAHTAGVHRGRAGHDRRGHDAGARHCRFGGYGRIGRNG